MTIDGATAGFLVAILAQTAMIAKALFDTTAIKNDMRNVRNDVVDLKVRVSKLETILHLLPCKRKSDQCPVE